MNLILPLITQRIREKVCTYEQDVPINGFTQQFTPTDPILDNVILGIRIIGRLSRLSKAGQASSYTSSRVAATSNVLEHA